MQKKYKMVKKKLAKFFAYDIKYLVPMMRA